MIPRRAVAAAIAIAVVCTPSCARRDSGPPWIPVTQARLESADGDSGWLMERRTYDAHAHVPFDQIDPSDIRRLLPVFTFDDPSIVGEETAPIVNGRYLIATLPGDRVVALDAADGRVLWTYTPDLANAATTHLCCEAVNRGAAAYGQSVYVAMIDGTVVALDARTGRTVWRTVLALPGNGYSFTGAPLAVDGEIIVGTAGGEYPVQGFIAALDANSGRVVWRRSTIAQDGEPGGASWPAHGPRHGGSAWGTGTYDPRTDTLYWGVGNPMPWRTDERPGDNLFTDSLLALAPRTGRIEWHYQFTPHDVWDYDGTNEPVLFDVRKGRASIPEIYQANRNGYFFSLDRADGAFVSAVPFVRSTTIAGYDAKGRAMMADRASPAGVICPGTIGAKNWPPSSYDPKTGLAFFGAVHACSRMIPDPQADNGEDPVQVPEPGAGGYGEFLAWDVAAGRPAWSVRSRLPWYDGALTTGSGLVFSGSADGTFYAFDERTGRVLWRYRLKSAIVGTPVSYMLDGRQYVAVFAGWDGAVARQGPLAAALARIPRGGRLYVFALR